MNTMFKIEYTTIQCNGSNGKTWPKKVTYAFGYALEIRIGQQFQGQDDGQFITYDAKKANLKFNQNGYMTLFLD